MTSQSVELAQELIRIESITPDDNGCQPLLSARLEALGFHCETLKFEDVTNLWATRGDAKPLLVFAGHTDVVPTGPLDQWSHPPFDGIIENGMLHGRGSADMKGSIACFLVACERFVANQPNHNGAIGLLITSDEEDIARWGTREVIDELDKRGQDIDLCIVGEPTSVKHCGDMIKVGRRGSLNGVLTIRGKQGHIAYPHLANNPLHFGLAGLQAMIDQTWDQGNENFPPTSFQFSNIHGGTGASNVIPGHFTANFNFRYSPETNARELIDTVESLLNNQGIDYEIEWEEPSLPYETKSSHLVDAVKAAITDVTGLTTDATATGGTSDGRFIAPTGAQVVELGPVNATIHQINEQVSIADLDVLTDIYESILKRMLIDS